MTRQAGIAGLLPASCATWLLLFAPCMSAADADDTPAAAEAVPVVAETIVELGAQLFFDKRLSRDGTMSCASCHDPAQAFTNPNPPVRPGIADTRRRRDVPSLLNVAEATPLHRDGSEPSLEVQILAPLFNAAEMANTMFEDVTSRLAAIPGYSAAFAKHFGAPPTIDNIGMALAAYERSLNATNAVFDRWRNGAGNAMTASALLGYNLFKGKAGCAACHVIGTQDEPRFTANEFFNTGIGFQSEARRAAETPDALTDRGREEVTHLRSDRYKFRTPTLRNVELTAPYMHDGSLKTLEDIVAYYNAGGSSDPEKDPRIKPLNLSTDEQQALVAFLKSLTSTALPKGPAGVQAD